jgi:hypothetical protein
MMCACDEAIARKHLLHQLDKGVELKTQERVPVTLGFQPNICRACRGLPLKGHPMAKIFGRTSKIRRYYWRELQFETLDRFAAWCESPDAAGRTYEEKQHAHDQIEAAVLEELKTLHATSPKYNFREPSQSEIIHKCQVEVIDLRATYLRSSEGQASFPLDGVESCGAEEFVARHFERQGYDAIKLESIPFHVLFGVFMWLVIQDPLDPRVRVVSFGDRRAFERREAGELIWALLPEDFGTSGYGKRRRRTVANHLAGVLEDRGKLQDLFDCWLSPSEKLRQYLWAYQEESIRKARHVIDILPPTVVKSILGYLTQNYWGRYLGWPDLLLHRESEWFFAEVKSSGDKLSDDQKRWIKDNHRYLHLPFKFVKLHKSKVVPGI